MANLISGRIERSKSDKFIECYLYLIMQFLTTSFWSEQVVAKFR